MGPVSAASVPAWTARSLTALVSLPALVTVSAVILAASVTRVGLELTVLLRAAK